MKVLHVIPAVAPRYGGPSVAATRMCAALGRQGVEVLLAASDADGQKRLPVPLARETDFEGVRAIFFPRAASEAFKWTPALGRWLRSHVASFDVVHVHAVFSHACLAAGHACRSASRPYVVRPLGSLDPWSLRRHPIRKRILLSLGARRLLQQAHGLHYTSTEERRLAEAALPGLAPGVVIPLGVDEEMFEGGFVAPPAGSPYVLSLSRLDAKKGVDVLIAAFHALESPAAAGWRLVVAGAGDAAYVSHLHALAAAGPAHDRIEFRGWVQGDARLSLIRGAALYALPSHQENFGISVAEAMACGVPVLVSPGVNLAADLEAAGAGWVADRDVSAWTSALCVAMADPEERRRRGERARTYASRFRWSSVAARLLALYDDLSRRAGAGRR